MNALAKRLSKEIQERKAELVMIGAGYVGLPTAALLADKGFKVRVVDTSSDIVNAVNSGGRTKEPFLGDIVARNVKSGRLSATSNLRTAIESASVLLVAVPTPIHGNRKPDLRILTSVIESIGRVMRKGILIAIVSTVPPGTIEGDIKTKLEVLTRLSADSDFFLAYTPERIAPGNAIRELLAGPRLVGGVGENSTGVALKLMKSICKKVLATDATVAEIAKLAENSFRDVNIAFANQLAVICECYGVDASEVIRLANTHDRVAIHKPGPGVGGPCLTKDPYLLVGNANCGDSGIITAARRINDGMPNHVVELVLLTLQRAGKNPLKSRVAILGTSYKADIDDTRGSPARPIIVRLKQAVGEVTAFDPRTEERFGAIDARNLRAATLKADCIVVITDHSEFRRMDIKSLKKLMRQRPGIVDTRRIIDSKEAQELGFIYCGIGFGWGDD